MKKQHFFRKKENRLRKRTFPSLEKTDLITLEKNLKKHKKCKIESPLKTKLLGSGLDGAKYMKNSRDFSFF